MIIIQKVDLHTPKLEKLNEMIDAGFKPIAWVPYNNRMIVFLEGSGPPYDTPEEMIDDMMDPLEVIVIENFDNLPEIKATICTGTTVAGNPCKASKFEGTEYCVAHQDQG